jgi:phospho-N-acetylmuramoyl-pentapeptide-transferase
VLYHLLLSLQDLFSPLNIFRYITFRTACAALTSVILTLVLLPRFTHLVRRKGFTERISEHAPENHAAKGGTPTSGGIVFLFASVLSTALWADVVNPFVLLSMFATIWLGFWGYIDDRVKQRGEKKKGLSKSVKFGGQLILAVLVLLFLKQVFPADYATKTQALFLKNTYLELGIFYFLFIVFVFVGSTNSVNLADGLDGLAAGAALAPMTVMLVVTYIAGHKVISEYLNVLHVPAAGELTVFAGAFLGCLSGFLWFNTHPASIFMGDTGSQALGGALGILGILSKQEILLAIAMGFFVLETISVIIQVICFRCTDGKRVFRRAPMHHHFEELGWPESKVVVRLWIISGFFAILALATLKVR